MQSNSEINCFVTQSDTLTVGVCEALRASGKSFDDYVTVGKDGSADALKSIAAVGPPPADLPGDPPAGGDRNGAAGHHEPYHLLRTGPGDGPAARHSGTAGREPCLTAGADAAAGSHGLSCGLSGGEACLPPVRRHRLCQRPRVRLPAGLLRPRAAGGAVPPAAPGGGQLRDVQLRLV